MFSKTNIVKTHRSETIDGQPGSEGGKHAYGGQSDSVEIGGVEGHVDHDGEAEDGQHHGFVAQG